MGARARGGAGTGAGTGAGAGTGGGTGAGSSHSSDEMVMRLAMAAVRKENGGDGNLLLAGPSVTVTLLPRAPRHRMALSPYLSCHPAHDTHTCPLLIRRSIRHSSDVQSIHSVNKNILYNGTLRHCLHGGHEGPTAGARGHHHLCTGPPHPSPIVRNKCPSSSPASYDGLKVLDPLQSCQTGGRVIVEMLLSGCKLVVRSDPSTTTQHTTHLCYLRWGFPRAATPPPLYYIF